MSDPLREAATRLADEWQHGTADDEYCERLDVACAALREALAIEAEYVYRARTATIKWYHRDTEELARADISTAFPATPADAVWVERSLKNPWERLP